MHAPGRVVVRECVMAMLQLQSPCFGVTPGGPGPYNVRAKSVICSAKGRLMSSSFDPTASQSHCCAYFFPFDDIPFSPVQRARKFSHVVGQSWLYNWNTTLCGRADGSREISMNTNGHWLLARCFCESNVHRQERLTRWSGDVSEHDNNSIWPCFTRLCQLSNS